MLLHVDDAELKAKGLRRHCVDGMTYVIYIGLDNGDMTSKQSARRRISLKQLENHLIAYNVS